LKNMSVNGNKQPPRKDRRLRRGDVSFVLFELIIDPYPIYISNRNRPS